MATTTRDPIWEACNAGRPDWWRPLAPNPWPGNPNAYECPWGCNGTGERPEFRHIAGGVCFACKGQGWILGRGSRPPQQRQQPAPQAPGPRRWRKDGGRIVPA